MTESILTIERLDKSFGGVMALNGVSLQLPDGEIVGLIGPNGAGKTTLFNTVSGAIQPDSGTVTFDNVDITTMPPYKVMHAGLGRTFQVPRVFEGMSVKDNLMFAAQNQLGNSPIRTVFTPTAVATEQAAIAERADDILSFLELNDLATEYASGLSGGQRKLLELGRILMTDPKLLMLDEPVAGVNPALTSRLLDRLHELNDDGMTILLIEHDMDVVMNNCDYVFVMDSGQVISSGTPSKVSADDRVIEAYLGEV